MTNDRLGELALGPQVSVPVLSHAQAERRGEAVVVFGALSAECYIVYDQLIGDQADPAASSDEAVRYLAAARFRRIEGLRLPPDVTRYASEAEWFAFSPAGFVLAETTVPEYIRLSVPTEEDLELVEKAAFSFIHLQEDRDPFEISTHTKDCEREIWESREEQELISQAEISARQCSACAWERSVWASVIKHTGDARYGRVARRALNLGATLKQIPTLITRTTARNWLFVQAVQGERDRREGQRMHQSRREAEGKGARA